MIPEKKWFTKLAGREYRLGLDLDDAGRPHEGSAKRGEKVLCVVPESGRAMVGFMLLEVVG